ncbi:ADP-ribosyl cyclase/cyclic ADP-ribose hydrolase [Patella vulgata]|uniref:ADP-ribosyl cyclase/cyclic ADP-ribose hydrolase n=1 Tax=Patella vulgata TaxID=6465 RepID=UPI0021806680|nr:ADP-ribosyl cyclase/cyclic ADP-ribose hydrolase [Patella vulgata]XP_050417328.1 ADP-ribosyl cyclase/cyclic ADP-ribose hydrolase [Patella vulgata]
MVIVNILVYVVIMVGCIKGDPGTSDHLQDIFIGRCWDYTEIKYKQQIGSMVVNCSDLWNTFYAAFSYRAPCDLSMQRYADFMAKASQTLPRNKAMFWSGTYNIAHEYADNGKRYVTLEDTLVGYLANQLSWCGSSSDGANMTRCPSWADCPLEASESFWASASKQFASSAIGDVYLMLDGSRDKPAYSPNSFFGKYELPNLQEVDTVVILVTHNVTEPPKETCTTGSLLELQEDIRSRGLIYNCIDDLDAVRHLLCADDPEARECKMVHPPTSHEIINTELPKFNSRPDRFYY